MVAPSRGAFALSALGLLGLASGCAVKSAALPPEVRAEGARLPIDYRFGAPDGSLDGIRVTDVRTPPRPAEDRERNLFFRKSWYRFDLADDRGPRWFVLCSHAGNNRSRPATSVVCTYEARRADDAPMSLVLVGTSTGAWSGSFFADGERYELTGTDEVVSLIPVHIGSAGLEITKDGERIGFVELMDDDMLLGWMFPEVDVATRRRLTPLYLTFGVIEDQRSMEDERPTDRALERRERRRRPLQMPDPTNDPRFAPHVDALNALGRHEEEAALLLHVPAHHDLTELRPVPVVGPDLRPERSRVSFDLMFPSLAFDAPVGTTVADEPASPLGWSFGFGLGLGATFADFVHLAATGQFQAVRPETGPPDAAFDVRPASSSNSWRFAVGGRVTVARLGKLRPYVGGEFVTSLWTANYRDIEDFDTSGVGFGGAPVIGTRFMLYDHGRRQAELLFEGRATFTDWQDPQRSSLAETAAGLDPEVEAWLDRIEATQRSITLGVLVALQVRI
jgi:hypothetical protein